MTTTSYLLDLFRIIEDKNNKIEELEQENDKLKHQLEQVQVSATHWEQNASYYRIHYCESLKQIARLEAWSTMLFTKLYAIECGDCAKNMVACKCDEEE